MNYWMLTITPENFRATRNLGFTVQGFTSRQRRKVDRMVARDRLLFYIKEARLFGATATIESTAFEEQTLVWTSRLLREVFPHRVRIAPKAVLDEGQYLDAAELAPRLEYIKKWPPEWWHLAFQGELHLLPRRDFELVEGEMQRLLTTRQPSQP
ncbi:MAG: EVE domain-containing protein [Chloroflexi bacterium]|nr:EVE domain-containing protein [Chloroflexota bacterium]